MKHTAGRLTALVASAVALVASLCLLTGCMDLTSEGVEEQNNNRQYMTRVNTCMEDLGLKLDAFNDAASRGDLVSMRTQADKAFKELDTLKAIETPEELQEVQDDYVKGCESLRDALNAYIDLYTEIDSATDEHPFDYATYDERIAEIQKTYDDGISALEAADSRAAEL